MTIKTHTLKCDLDPAAGTVHYKQCVRNGEDWNVTSDALFNLDALPNEIQDWCAVYGLRAVLADRTSDAKKLGIDKLEWMREIYEMFKGGDWNKPRASGAQVDKALVHLIVELKGCTAVEAEAALRQAGKEWIEAAKERYAEDLARIRRELVSAPALDLDGLI